MKRKQCCHCLFNVWNGYLLSEFSPPAFKGVSSTLCTYDCMFAFASERPAPARLLVCKRPVTNGANHCCRCGHAAPSPVLRCSSPAYLLSLVAALPGDDMGSSILASQLPLPVASTPCRALSCHYSPSGTGCYHSTAAPHNAPHSCFLRSLVGSRYLSARLSLACFCPSVLQTATARLRTRSSHTRTLLLISLPPGHSIFHHTPV